MKKFFTIVASAILVGASTFAAITWGDGGVENLAKGANVIVSSNFGAANAITDGEDGSSWQAAKAVHDKMETPQDWVLIDLGESKTMTDLEIIWQDAHCKKYSVYVSDNLPTITDENVSTGDDATGEAYKKIAEDWFNGKTAAATGGDNSEVGYTENITFEKAQTGQYVLIYANEYNGFGKEYGMRIFEVRLANIEDRDAITTLMATQEGNAMAGGEAVNVTLTLLNKVGEEVTDAEATYTLTCDDKAVSIEGNTNVFSVKASKAGSYTLKATAKVKVGEGEKTLEATHIFTAAFNWTGVTNIATNKTIQGRTKAENNNPAANAVDGNEETFYQYDGEWNGGDSWLLVDLGDVYMVDAIGASYGDLSGGQCVFGYALEVSDDLNNKIEEGTDYKWDQIDNNTGWEYTNSIVRTSNTISTHVFDTPVKAHYIMVRDADNPNGKPCVKEIYVNGELYVTPKATSIEISASDNYVVAGTQVTISTVVKDQYDAVMESEKATISFENTEKATLENNVFTANEMGDYVITATCGEGENAISEEFIVHVVTTSDYVFGGDKEPLACTATATNATKVEADKIFNRNGDQVSVEFNNTFPATLEMTFDKVQNFTMLDFYWETACPSNYDLTVTYEDGTSATVNVLSDRDTDAKNPNDKVVHKTAETRAAETDGIAKISLENVKKLTLTIKETKHSDWAVKLYGIDAYGTEAPATEMEIKLEGKAQYGTLILPFAHEVPSGLEVYSIKEVKETIAQDYKILSLEQLNGKMEANTPYIVKFFNYNFTFKGFATNEEDEYADASGLLHGVLKAATAPENSFVLQNQNDKLGFFKVITNDITVPANRCYITLASNEVKALVFDQNDVDAIENIATSEALVNVYDMNGVLVRKNVKACEALQGLQKGIYVVDGAKKAVK